MAAAILIASDTAANWTAANPVLQQGEMGLETDTRKRKTGDGSTPWTSLSYDATGGAVADHTYIRVSEGPLSFTDTRVGGDPAAADNAAALNQAMSMLPTGGEVFVPKGVYGFATAPNPLPGGVTMRGEGYDYATPGTTAATRPSYGTVFRATANMDHLIKIGTRNDLSSTSFTGGELERMVVDGNSHMTTAAVIMADKRCRLRHTEIYAGTASTAQAAVLMACQNGNIEDSCVISGEGNGDALLVTGTGVIDNKIWASQIREPGATGAAIRLLNAGQIDIQLNHLWAGANGVAAGAQGLVVLQATGTGGVSKTLIEGNTIEGVLGPEIYIDAATSPAFIRGVLIASNRFYANTNVPDATYPVVAVASGVISAVSFVGNMVEGGGSANRYKSLFDIAAAVTSTSGWEVAGNTATYVAALLTGSTPPSPLHHTGTSVHNGATWKRTNSGGLATFTGDGTATSFSIPHGCITTPAVVTVTAASPAAAAPCYVTEDATNVTVTFTTAPTNGASVKLNWSADC